MVSQINKQERYRLVSTTWIHIKIIPVWVFPVPFPESHLHYKQFPNKQSNYSTVSFNTIELGILYSGLRRRRNFLDKKKIQKLYPSLLRRLV